MLNNICFFEKRAFYDLMCKNIAEPGRPQITIWCVRMACWIPKAKNPHSEYVILLLFCCNNGCTNAAQCYITVHYLSCYTNLVFQDSTSNSKRAWWGQQSDAM